MKLYINGECCDGKGKELSVINPATEQTVSSFYGASPAQATEALTAAQNAFAAWSALTTPERGVWIEKIAHALEKRREEICQLVMQETGKPRATATPEVFALPAQLRYFYQQALSMTGEIIPDNRPGSVNQIVKKPLGVVVAHLAWNFPIMNLIYKIGPALSVGCTIVIKPAAKTPLSALFVGQLLHEMGLPAGVVNIVAGSSKDLAEPLNGSTIPAMLTMIGSSASGRVMMKQAATSIKHFSLELGGNAPAILLADANVKDAAAKLSYVKFMNAGQVCVTPNRFFVHRNLLEEFVTIAKATAAAAVFGWGDEAGATMGPMITAHDRVRMQDLVADAIAKGATLVCGGGIPATKTCGYYFEPTILTGITPDMRVYREEIFGPIMAIMAINDETDVVKLANDTEYGLAAFVYTSDINKGHRIADAIQSGTVCINEPRFDIHLPHGGIKESGIGKDCSKYSVEEYCYLKRISYKI